MRPDPLRGLRAVFASGLIAITAAGQDATSSQDAQERFRQAAASARGGEPDRALDLLGRALEAGADATLSLVEPGFASLRELPEFRALVKAHTRASVATIVPASERGEPMWIRAQVVEASGSPVPGALVYVYQTDAEGLYSSTNDNQNPRIFAYLRTDENGRIRFRSVRPGGYPDSTIAQHVHYRISVPGRPDHVAEWFFDDDPRLTDERRARAAEQGLPIVSLARDGGAVWRGEVRLPLPPVAGRTPAQESPSEPPANGYTCPPCGCETCDRIYESPGTCPASDCGMQLVAVGAAAGGAAPVRTPRNVAILVHEGVELLDFAGPGEAFSAARLPDGSGRGFNVYLVAASLDPIISQGFVTITPGYTFETCPEPDLIVLPGGATGRAMRDAATMQWIEAAAPEAEVVLTVCTGALLLARARLLDGLHATTHHGSLDSLRRMAPEATVHEGARYVDNGRYVTSAGVSAGIDGALHVIKRLLGADSASAAAWYMEYDWTPEEDAENGLVVGPSR